jgi:hypothetical protein
MLFSYRQKLVITCILVELTGYGQFNSLSIVTTADNVISYKQTPAAPVERAIQAAIAYRDVFLEICGFLL